MSRLHRFRAGVAVVVAALALARPAAAAPLVDSTVGGMVFTGPTSAHVSALYWNPAATGLVRGFHVYVSGQLHDDLYHVERAPIDTATGEPSATVQGDARKSFAPAKDTLLTPGGFAGFTWDLGNDALAFGVAAYAPFVDVQPSGKPQLRYHTQGGYLYSTFVTFAISYRINPRWIAGAGLSTVFSRARLRFSFDQKLELCAAPPCDVENPAETSDFDITASSGTTPAVAFNGGLMWKARPDLWLALAYHSPPGFSSVSLPGSATVTTAPNPDRRTLHGDAEVNFSLPHILQVGARWDALPGRWQLLGSVRAIFLSAVDEFDLRLAGPELRTAKVREWVPRYRGLDNALLIEAGIETPAGQATRWGLRLRFDTGGASKEYVAPEQIAGPSFDLAAGVARSLFGSLSLTLAGSAGIMLPRHVGESAYSPRAQTNCVASGYDLDHCESARLGSAIDTAAGDYERYNFAAMLGLSWDTL